MVFKMPPSRASLVCCPHHFDERRAHCLGGHQRSGIYSVIAPLPGNYYLRVTLPPGAVLSSKNQGANDQADSDANPSGVTDQFNIASNVISTTIWDFGLFFPRQRYTPLPPARLLDTRSTGVTVDGVNLWAAHSPCDHLRV